MPYDTKILKQKAIEAIDKNRLIFVEDICAFIGISKSTFYDHFQVNTNDYDDLKGLLEQNKINLKVSIRKMWYDRKSDTGLMALYKLCSTAEEHRKLQQNYEPAREQNDTDKTIVILPAKDIIPQENVDNVD